MQEAVIKRLLKFAGLPTSGQMRLCDGRTGKMFDMPTTVGYSYIYKLHHMVEDKAHARSRGRYMSRTQQPVQGRSNHGGQRLGEMEVWALMAHGAAFNLLEMTTVKSDDMYGRRSVEREIIRTTAELDVVGEKQKGGVLLGDILPSYTGSSGAFEAALYEMRCLCLDIYEHLDEPASEEFDAIDDPTLSPEDRLNMLFK